MKNVIILLLLAFGVNGYGQIINFPDANFKNALVNTKCVDTNGDNVGDSDADLNNDGEIDVSEALLVFDLQIRNRNISSLAGIEYCINLKKLNCNFNKLTSLNLKGLNKLEDLDCSYNKLTYLDVQGLKDLKYFYCASNQLTSIDLQGLSNLVLFHCFENQISELNLKGLFNLTHLYCLNNKLTFLDVQESKNLEYLTCRSNQITSINVNSLTKLTTLDCSYNQLTTLNISGLTKLIELKCSYNKLVILDVKELRNLITLNCEINKLKILDVKELINLTELNCQDNQLESLDMKGLLNLKVLDCGKNQLNSLEVKGLTNLVKLYCNGNQLTILDLQGLKYIWHLLCTDNNLKSLYIKGTPLLTHYTQMLSFIRNPELRFICCNEEIISEIKKVTKANGQNCEVNSYCSFTPGGEFYTIQGQNLYDINNRGCNDPDSKVSNINYKISNGNITGNFITNSTGNYSIPVQAGTHTIIPMLENPDHFLFTPTSITVTFPSTSDTITQNFCITPKGTFRQTNITVIPLSPPARPGFEAKYKIVWENAGNQIESGTLNFTYDKRLLDYISATQTADQVADGIVKWNFTNLLPFEKREITVTLKVNRPTDTPAVNAGDKLYLTASILDNIFTLENTVVGSYDPNDKTCLQGDRVKPDMVGKYVDYLIRFENTGNYAAENIVIKDIIDTKTFDVSSLQITDASHKVYTRIEGNKVEFIFENIQLPFDDANNDGYVAFKIKTLPTLVIGDSLKNLADIYFDYNFPIRTNEAQTTIALPVFTKDSTDVNIHPNPVRDILYIESIENWTKAEIFDITGRIMRSNTLNGHTIDVSELDSGTYFIRLKDGEKVGLVKFVKM